MTKQPTPEVTLHDRTMTTDMVEVSGFGGSYEEGCRLMVLAGVEWLAQHPGAKPKVSHYRNVMGIDHDDNVYAEQLTKAMLDAPYNDNGTQTTVGKYGATGAMVQYSKMHALRANAVGWDEYCRESRERLSKERDA